MRIRNKKRYRSEAAPRCRTRDGYIYISVLAVTMILSVLAMVMLTHTRLGSHMIEAHHSHLHARILSDCAVDHAIAAINVNANWRDPTLGYLIDTEYPATPPTVGEGTFAWKLSDTDGSLNDNPADGVTITAFGRVNGYTYTQQVTASPAGSGLDSLGVCVATSNSHNISGGTLVADEPVATNKTCNAWGGAQIYADIEATTGAFGGTFHQSTTTPNARSLPDPSSLFSYYLSRGTNVNLTSLPFVGGYYELNNVVLSPSVNPFGGPNSEGIYVIDCAIDDISYSVRIRDSRIVGTLVLLDSGSNRVEGTVSWSAAIPNFPALLADGDIHFAHDSTSLLSEATEGTNFNPPGAAYYGGTDGDLADSYPSLINGAVYAKGDATMSSNPRIHGVIVADGKFEMSSGSVDLIHNPIYLSAPPPGFESGTGSSVQLVAGTRKRIVSP